MSTLAESVPAAALPPTPSQYAAGDDLPITEVQRRLFTTAELAAAAEAFAINSFIGEASFPLHCCDAVHCSA